MQEKIHAHTADLIKVQRGVVAQGAYSSQFHQTIIFSTLHRLVSFKPKGEKGCKYKRSIQNEHSIIWKR